MRHYFLPLIAAVAAAAVLFSACTPEPPPKTSFQTVEDQRAQGRSNATLVAADYQRQNPRIQGWDVIVKADSSHTADCPQGDGWTEVVFMRAERDGNKNLAIEKAEVMCSTVSFNEGCVMKSPTNNWDKHPKKQMDGHCGNVHEVPMPLPKIAGARN